MNFSRLTAAMCLSLCATLALAQDVPALDREHRRGMSYEEYSSVRENMRKRMEKMQETKRKQPAVEDSVQPVPDSTYGQGYHARNQRDAAAVERPERVERVERPERIERFNRSDMGRR